MQNNLYIQIPWMIWIVALNRGKSELQMHITGYWEMVWPRIIPNKLVLIKTKSTLYRYYFDYLMCAIYSVIGVTPQLVFIVAKILGICGLSPIAFRLSQSEFRYRWVILLLGILYSITMKCTSLLIIIKNHRFNSKSSLKHVYPSWKYASNKAKSSQLRYIWTKSIFCWIFLLPVDLTSNGMPY